MGVLFLHPLTDPTVVQVRDIFDRQVRQMARLLDDLLDVSQIAQGKAMLHKEQINLATVTAQAAQASESLLSARQLRFEVAVPAETVWLNADPTRLVQILVNLLNNAAKYTDPGGRVWLSAAQEGAEAVIRAAPREGWASAWPWYAASWSCTLARLRPRARAQVRAANLSCACLPWSARVALPSK